MGFLKLNRFGEAAEPGFDPAVILEKVQQMFPNVKVFPGDQLALSAQRAETAGVADHIIESLRRNQQAYGPSYAFEIPIEGGKSIEGRARRFDVTFVFAEPLSRQWCERLRDFLRDLGPGNLESSAS